MKHHSAKQIAQILDEHAAGMPIATSYGPKLVTA